VRYRTEESYTERRVYGYRERVRTYRETGSERERERGHTDRQAI
jgi:hypothetical protein